MKKREELYLTTEYWLENLQNEIFSEVYTYMEEKKISKAELAKKLGFSRSYISQVLNGEFNFSLKKLIELSLAINKTPALEFRDIAEFIKKKENNLEILKSGMSINVQIEGINEYSFNIDELDGVSELSA